MTYKEKEIRYEPSGRLSVMRIKCWQDEEDIYWDNQKHDEFTRVIYVQGGCHPARQPISKKQFRILCELRPTVQEIADCFKVSPDAIENFCKRAFNEFEYKSLPELISMIGSAYKFNLRRFLWTHAEKSASMAIFLAKNYLDMSENPGPGNENIQIETVNYHVAKGKDIGLWNEAKKQKIKIPNTQAPPPSP